MIETAIIRESQTDDSVSVFFHVDELPAHHVETFPNVGAAKAAHPELKWGEPHAGADRDVVAVAPAGRNASE